MSSADDNKLITETGESFRDAVSNIDKSGKRVWIYPSKPKGKLHRWRLVVGYLLILIFFAAPFLKIDGQPLILIDVINRQFILFGMAFWPQDFYIFALAFLALAVFIIIFTAVLGRLWCGWLCPQTIFMELVFRKIEHFIEGDGNKLKKTDEAPMTGLKFIKKTIKHILFIAVSLIVMTFLASYVVGMEKVLSIISSPYENAGGFTAVLVMSGVFYFIFARFREQACIYVCPYARLQSVLIDKNSLIVAYDNKRGEPRGKLSKEIVSSNGDCIDCGMCVRVCPTGIDIRNGLQLECVNCAACIDACNSVMDKVKKPRKLIRYASLNQISEGLKFKITPRLILYTLALTLLLGIVSFLLTTRSDVEATILRAKGTIFIENPNGTVSNLFTAKIANKTFKTLELELKTDGIPGTVSIVGGKKLIIQPDKLIETAFFVEVPKSAIHRPNTKIFINVLSNGKKLYSKKTSFSGPMKGAVK